MTGHYPGGVDDTTATELKDLAASLDSVEAAMDLEGLRREVAELEQQVSSPDLWDDVETAQQLTSSFTHKAADLKRAESLRSRLDDLGTLYEMADEESGADSNDLRAEADTERAALLADVAAFEVRTLLSGEYDERDALVTVRAEAGGVDSAGLGTDGDHRLALVVLAGQQGPDLLGVDLPLQ